MRVHMAGLPAVDTSRALERRSPPRTLRDRVVATLRESIVSGRIPPGARLSEPSLARELQVSRGPIREAIRELAAEGLVRIEARIGTFVTRPEAREIAEAFAIKSVLEGLAARLACAEGTEESRRAHLAPHLAALDRVDLASDSRAYLAATRSFHEAILELAGNARLAALHRTLNDQLQRLCGPLVTPDLVIRYAQEHRAIAAAIAANRPTQAERLSRLHVARSGDRLLEIGARGQRRRFGS
ncbi:MAG TPA: GntR family transcriptional regulator [Thermodesulfobacteriota bacterium]